MTTVVNDSILRARFSLFDEDSKGALTAVELTNVFRSLGWTDINSHHTYNLMQTNFGVGTVKAAAVEEKAPAAPVVEDNKVEEEEEPVVEKEKKTKLVLVKRRIYNNVNAAKKKKDAIVNEADKEAQIVAAEEDEQKQQEGAEGEEEENIASPNAAEDEGVVSETEENDADSNVPAQNLNDTQAGGEGSAVAAAAAGEDAAAVDEDEEEEEEYNGDELDYEEVEEYEEVPEEEEEAEADITPTPAAAAAAEEKKTNNNKDDAAAGPIEYNTEACEKVTFDQFKALIAKVQIQKDSPLECYKAFTLMDFAQNGILGEQDLHEVAMRMHGHHLSAKQRARMVRSILMVADTNHDDLLSLPEFRGACAKGGMGTEDGPLDLAVLVVEQPPEPVHHNASTAASEHNNTSFGGNAAGARRRSSAGSSIHLPRSRTNSHVAGGAGGAYNHANVAAATQRVFENSSFPQANDADDENAENGQDGYDDGEGGPSKQTFNFEGIDVTFTDGMIAKDDVAAFFRECGELLVGEDFDRWFDVEDADNDGFLSEEQFRATLEIFLGEDTQ